MQTTKLNTLKFGHEYPGANINARTTHRDVELDALVASIKAEGILQSLLVTKHPKSNGALFVIAGNRRLAALRKLKWEDDVPVIVREDVTPGSALAMSLAENVTQCPLHPVDRYEAFAELAKQGLSEGDIAARYCVSDRTVKQCLALGQLHPEILKVWRADEIRAETARAFTLEPDQKRQLAVYKELAKAGNVWETPVRRALGGGGDNETKRLLKFIGTDAYKAAGGTVKEDLFGENHGIGDPALVAKLASEKAAAEKARLLAEGWSWVEAAESLPNAWSWGWEKLQGKPNHTAEEKKRVKEIDLRVKALDKLMEKQEEGGDDNTDYEGEAETLAEERDAINEAAASRGFNPAQRSKSGVVMQLGHDGALELRYGIVKPKDVKNVDSKDLSASGQRKKAKAQAGGGVSNALAMRLSEQLTIAVANALVKQPDVAISALIAGYSAPTAAPVHVSLQHMTVTCENKQKQRHLSAGSFVAGFDMMLKAGTKRNDALAAIAADALSFRTHDASRKPLSDKSAVAIIGALKASEVNKALRDVFEAKDYFAGVSGAIRLIAIREACGEDAASRASKLRKDEQVKFALANVPKTGWLPPELRVAAYDGPKGTAKTAKGTARKTSPAASARSKKTTR